MIPNFKSSKELKEYCLEHNCSNCELINDCEDIKGKTLRFGNTVLESALEQLFLYYRKKKLEKLLS